MINYETSKIYKIVCNKTNKIYIGSTTKKYLSSRLSGHKYSFENNLQVKSSEIIKNGDYNILLIENYPCNSKDELRARERFYIENNECVNRLKPGRTKKEYYQDNKEHIKKNVKLWGDNNKEKVKEYKKKYKLENKEKRKEKITCSCGLTITKDHKARHERTQKHLKSISN